MVHPGDPVCLASGPNDLALRVRTGLVKGQRDQCWPRANNRGRADRYHREAVYIREDALLDALARFYADRVFGPHRAAALTADLDTIDDRAAADRQAERERLQRRIADLTRRGRLVQHLQASECARSW